MNWWIINL